MFRPTQSVPLLVGILRPLPERNYLVNVTLTKIIQKAAPYLADPVNFLGRTVSVGRDTAQIVSPILI